MGSLEILNPNQWCLHDFKTFVVVVVDKSTFARLLKEVKFRAPLFFFSCLKAYAGEIFFSATGLET